VKVAPTLELAVEALVMAGTAPAPAPATADTLTVVTALVPEALVAVKGSSTPAVVKVPLTKPVDGLMEMGALPPVLA